MMDEAALLPWQQVKRLPEYENEWRGRRDFIPPLIEDISVLLRDGETANVVSFQAGYGDGSYPYYIGETKSGDIAILMMVFDVFDTDANAEHPINGP